MSSLITNLSVSPYWDDYSENKQFYRILFVPARAVQVREMNQLQAMVQTQISRFADHQFKDGSVVSGCNINYIPNLHFVRVGVYNENTSNVEFTTERLENYLLVSPDTGLRASIIIARGGYLGKYPDTSVLYINYLNKGKMGNIEVETFLPNELLEIYDERQDKFAPNLNLGYRYNTINLINETLVTPDSKGIAYGITVGDGVIYQKGYFVKVNPHTIVVRDYDKEVDDMMVGFETNETIVSYFSDNSLIDPVDNSNRSGIGADRLSLSPNLVAKNRMDIKADDNFFPIVEFGKEELPVKQNTDPEYNILGEEMAKRTFEESGDYYVKPFLTSTKSTEKNKEFSYVISPGVAYVKGERVELIGNIEIPVERGIDTKFFNNNMISLNFGNYVKVKEVKGFPDDGKILTYSIFNSVATAFTSDRNPKANPPGTKIGELKVRQFATNSTSYGHANGELRLYIFDIKMNSGYSFERDAKSISNTTIPQGFMADFILENSKVKIYDQHNNSLIFPSGPIGIKTYRDPSGANDNLYSKYEITTATMNNQGKATFTIENPLPGGINRLFASVGEVPVSNRMNVIIVPEDTITVGGDTFKKLAPISPEKYKLTVLSTSQFLLEFLGTPTQSNIKLFGHYPVMRNEAVQSKKEITTDTVYVKVDLNIHPSGISGPWCLGLTDIVKIESIHVGSNFSTANPDRKSWFRLDNGQKQDTIDLGFLNVKPEFLSNLNLATNKRLLIGLKVFKHSFNTGVGFFNIDSYEVLQPDDTPTATSISFDDVPVVNGYQLRDCIDFRHIVNNTATITDNPNSASINPSDVRVFTTTGDNSNYLGVSGGTFASDIQAYLPRIDLIQVGKGGNFVVKSSLSDENPRPPKPDDDMMSIAYGFVPPFPGVTATDNLKFDPSKPRIKTNLSGYRGYTMKDIGALDRRISRLEYYQVLSALEQSAKDYSVKDENGLDRFKNGIFADPFNNHSLGDVSNFEYNIALDERNSLIRPKIDRETIDLDIIPNSETNIKIINSKFAIIDYDRVIEIKQDLASKVRNVTESVWNWAGDIKLFPEFDHHKDEISLPEVNVTIDNSSPWEQFANSPFNQMFGDWNTTTTSQTSQVGGLWTRSLGAGINQQGITQQTTTTTTSSRDIIRMGFDGATTTKHDLGSSLVDVSISPWMRSRNVGFIVNSLRPNSRVWAFFDGEPVSEFCAPGKINPLRYNSANGQITITDGDEDKVIERTAAFGSPLMTDANGNLYGVFRIPAERFKVGERTLLITDVDNLITSSDATTTSATGKYTASSMTTTSRGQSITTVQPNLNFNTTQETVITSSTTTRDVVTMTWATPSDPPRRTERDANGNAGRGDGSDPLGQSVQINVPSSGLFLDSIGVYFQKKSASMGITCYITEMNAGMPDSSKVIGTSYLKSSEVKTSADSSVETIFKFNEIPYLTNGKYYAFFLKPDGDSPDYLVWMSEVGGIDILTGVKIFSNPYIGTAFKSANSQSWDVLQTEDMKFNLYRCNFKELEGSLKFKEHPLNILKVSNVIMVANNKIEPGDIIRVATNISSTTPMLGSDDYKGIVKSFDDVRDILILDENIKKAIAPNSRLLIYRPLDVTTGDAGLNATSLVGTVDLVADISSPIEYSIIVPKISTITPGGTNVGFKFIGSNNTQVKDTEKFNIQSDTELEFLDKMRYVYSNFEVSDLNDHNLEIEAKLLCSDKFVSPIIDLRRKSVLLIRNDVNNDISDEETRQGKLKTKYVSKIFNLAEDQYAEDIIVLLSAHIPIGTNVHVFGKFLSYEDSTLDFYQKKWSKLDLEGSMVYTSKYDRGTNREYKFKLPSRASTNDQIAVKNLTTGIIEYRGASGEIFTGFKSFAIKIALSSEDPVVVPLVDDVRGICLQV